MRVGLACGGDVIAANESRFAGKFESECAGCFNGWNGGQGYREIGVESPGTSNM